MTLSTSTPYSIRQGAAAKPVHAVDEQRIAASHETHHQFLLRPLRISAGCFVGKNFVKFNAIQLPLSILVNCANASIANALSVHTPP
jgi:hypothetical protein